jgi:hypothetical protein
MLRTAASMSQRPIELHQWKRSLAFRFNIQKVRHDFLENGILKKRVVLFLRRCWMFHYGLEYHLRGEEMHFVLQ